MKTLDDLTSNLQETEPERALKLEIGGKLIALRNRKDLSQEQLAKLSEVDLKTIVEIEDGVETPSLETLIRLTKAMEHRVAVSFDPN